eukprot:TRINITY_DN544_c1_g1_i1.p1 TRINITY_DN544_c1_g1~~TRINITY_DN544_c1_g1_i1.p1  ORF type:complete len:1064 (+),score=409.76 TRINITY_DN544_c1_g1_i1:55-3246(+)
MSINDADSRTVRSHRMFLDALGVDRGSFSGCSSHASTPRAMTPMMTPRAGAVTPSMRSRGMTPVAPPEFEEDADELVWFDDRDDGLMQQLNDLQSDTDKEGDKEYELKRLERETAKINTRLYVQKAALYVKDCLVGYHFPFLDTKIGYYKFYRSNMVTKILSFTVIMNIALAMLQVRIGTDSQENMRTNVFNPILVVTELWCVVVFTCQCFLQFSFMGYRRYFKHNLCLILFICTVLYTIDLAVVPLIYGDTPVFTTILDRDRPFLRFYIRPIFAVLHFSGLRNTVPSILKTAVALIPVVLFIFIFLCIFAIYGFMLFNKRNAYFASTPWALYQLLIALTTANFPDVMIQSYAHPYQVTSHTSGPYLNNETGRYVTTQTWEVEQNDSTSFDFSWNSISWHASPCFFVLFYLIGLYFLLSVAFAVVYNVYKEHLKKTVLYEYSFRQRMLGRAYHCLIQYIDGGYDEFNRRLTVLHHEVHRPQHHTAVSSPPKDTQPGKLELASLQAHDELNRMDKLLDDFRARALSSIQFENGVAAAPVRMGAKKHKSDTTEVTEYIFNLLYDELFPPTKKDKELAEEEAYIKVDSTVGLLNEACIDEYGFTLPQGCTGVVTRVPEEGQLLYGVMFGTVRYMAAAEEIILVEPLGSRERIVRVMFHAMDLNGSRTLDMKQFRALYQMLQLKVRIIKDSRRWAEKVLPEWVYHSRTFQAVIWFGASKWVDRVIDVFIIGSVVLMTIHFEYVATLDTDSNGQEELTTAWYNFMYAEILVGIVFDIEAFLKIISLGWTEYWSKKWNRFDFMVTAVNTCIYITFGILTLFYGTRKSVYMVMEINDVNSYDNSPDLIMIVLLGRLLRVIRIVSENKSFRYILKTFSNILPIFGAYTAALLVVYYYFASTGMLLFRGVSPPYGTAYSNSNYYALNFESFYASCITLWCLMVVNNWFIIVDGYRAALGNWVLIYFVTFWLISVLLIMNIVTALVVEVWGSQWELNKEKAINIDKNPLAVRIQDLNYLTPNDGTDYYRLGLPPDPDGSRPTFKVSYANYSHKVRLALERIFLNQKGFQHVIV